MAILAFFAVCAKFFTSAERAQHGDHQERANDSFDIFHGVLTKRV